MLQLSPDARALLTAFADAIEAAQALGGDLSHITGAASKAAEQAAPISGVLTLWGDLQATQVEADTMGDAIELAQHYLSEASRLANAARVSPEISRAEALRLWLLERWEEPEVLVRDVMQRGPNQLRESPKARAAIALLVAHSWLVPLPAGTIIRGTARKEGWIIVRGATDVVDVRAKLAELKGHHPATSATIATRASVRTPVSQKSQVSQPSQPGDADPRVAEVARVAGGEPLRTAATDPGESSDSNASLPFHDLTFDAFEERAAIRQFDGGQSKDEAERAALIDVAAQFSVTTACLRKRWLADPDAKAYLGFLVSRGPTPLHVAASGLGWPLERAWAAEARLRACGVLRRRGASLAEPEAVRGEV